MSKYRFMIGLVICNLSLAAAQSPDPVVLSYQRNFIRASISTKLELLNDASRITTVNMTPLYTDALVFVKNAYPLLGTDSQLVELASAAATRSSAYNDPAVLPVLRDVFVGINETGIRIAALNTFSVLAAGRKDDIEFLNAWFAQASADPKTLAACARVLGKLGDASSFDALFRAATGNLDSGVVQAAASALNEIDDGYTENILARIGNNGIQETYAAFSFAMQKAGLPVTDRGRIAEAAFGYAVETRNETDTGTIKTRALVKESLMTLTALKWSQASPLVVKYFYLTQGDYKKDRANVDDLVPVVECMGTMGTSEAAQALSIFLGLLNSDTEQKKNYNEQLMLVVIQALGDLGDKSAFDYLLYVGYLDYPETVKKASRDALARLEW